MPGSVKLMSLPGVPAWSLVKKLELVLRKVRVPLLPVPPDLPMVTSAEPASPSTASEPVAVIVFAFCDSIESVIDCWVLNIGIVLALLPDAVTAPDIPLQLP